MVGPCKRIQPFIEEQKKLYTNTNFEVVDVDDENYSSLVEHFGINAMPTFIFFKNGNNLATEVGCTKENIQNKLAT